MIKKQTAARLVNNVGLSCAISWLRTALRHEIRVLTYHRIGKYRYCNDYKYNRDLYTATPDEFAWQIDHLRRNWHPISCAQLNDAFDRKVTLPKKPIIITFDDGYEDFYVEAFPILKASSVPATIFLSTDYIGSKQTFWFDWVVNFFMTTKKDRLVISQIDATFNGNIGAESRRKFANDVVSLLKKVPNTLRLNILADLKAQADEKVGTDRVSRPLSWSQVLEIANNGVEIGSHAASHPVLSMLSDDELTSELADSRLILRQKTGQEIDAIAYPNGQREDFDERVKKACAKVGYRLAFSQLGGINYLSRQDHYELRRLNPEPSDDRHVFAAALAMPEIFCR